MRELACSPWPENESAQYFRSHHNGVRKVSSTERFVIKISLVGINAFQEADSQDPTCQPKVTSFRPCCLAKGRNLWDGSPVG